MKMTVSRIRVVVLGAPRCGKSAVVVRYLTKRYIGEYSSTGDFLYTHRVAFDGAVSEVEILDTSSCAIRGCLPDHIRWGDAFAVVYSVCERRSFIAAAELLSLLERTRLPGCAAVTLLGNKRDLEHAREVHAEEGQELSLRFGCQFYEVSAAESCAGAALAFHALLREARALALLLPSPRRKLAAYSVSKVHREVHAEEGQELSLRFGCQFYEVSAAESCAGAALAFHALLREARALALLLPSPRRKLAAYSVSKVHREVHAEEGQELSLRFGCQFYEVSAAESCAGAALAFHALLREARALALLLPSPRRKLAAYSVSKVIGTIFGKNSKSVRKKRPSLSI